MQEVRRPSVPQFAPLFSSLQQQQQQRSLPRQPQVPDRSQDSMRQPPASNGPDHAVTGLVMLQPSASEIAEEQAAPSGVAAGQEHAQLFDGPNDDQPIADPAEGKYLAGDCFLQSSLQCHPFA